MIELEKATVQDAAIIYNCQVKSFRPLLEKYKDYDHSPANETIERAVERINNPQGGFYKIMMNNNLVGAICIYWKNNDAFWISPMFILPSYQGKGIAQKTLQLVEEMFPHAKSWELSTLLEEKRNCYLYEKVGYKRTEVSKKVNERATLIFYKKIC
ncbi:Acetyltransferase (GNAT) family protein [Oceanobacillus limi]|uniref:Acetyltransferase (GNAT) family protein n=1 Tax=Oceanobacillus limi TaxID=930131 RepID=A0A1I0CI31_9BACI|nr:GNAT family N-acetyltransferase [Oceanobacillus limi]SET18793.1 Acetyltransferase (GNAT) family protein [Oceanobacillus limi]